MKKKYKIVSKTVFFFIYNKKMKRNIKNKLKSLTQNQISRVFIRMKGEKRKYSKNKMIYLLLKPIFQKYSMERNKHEYYNKEIPLNVKEYYEYLESKLGEELEEYHIPYEIREEEDGKYIFRTKYCGKPLNHRRIPNEKLKKGEEWAKRKLRELHNQNLIHGDLINIDSSGRVVINRGNILFNEYTDEYRFIDMGFDKTKIKLNFNDRNLRKELEREKELLERYETEYLPSVKKETKYAQINVNPYDINPIDIL